MRQRHVFVLMLLSALAAGCLPARSERVRALLDPFRTLNGPTGEDVVQMDVALLERPVGDRYLNQELWDLADEQVVGFERKSRLDENGLRVGLIGGMPPAGLQALLTSERTCANPRRLRLRAGNPTPITLAPTRTSCKFTVHDENGATDAALEQAQCLFQVVPTLQEDGRLLLRFTPHIKHGETTLAPRPVQDPSGAMRWQLTSEQPTETYAHLSWEVTLGANDYVLVGTRIERADTLGHRCFLLTESQPAVQRLLVIRACRTTPAATSPDGPSVKAPPLAVQAGLSTARGAGR